MPNNQIKSLAKKYNTSEDKAEQAWEEAKKKVEKQYNMGEDNKQFYKLTYSITRSILKGRTMDKTAETLKELGKRYYVHKYAQYKADKAKQAAEYLVDNKVLGA